MSQPIDPARVSRFAARRLAARPELAGELAARAAFTRAEMEQALAGAAADDEPALKRRLRELRERVVLRVMARDVAGSAALAAGSAARARPCVSGRALRCSGRGAMRERRAEGRREVERRELAQHVKLGPGGIRELEFIAQARRLVRGGRDSGLTVRPTLPGLAELA